MCKLAKADDPDYFQLRGHVPKQLALRFKAICSMRQIDFGTGLEEALEPWIEKEEKRLLPKEPRSVVSQPETIAQVVQQNFWTLRQHNIENIDAIAGGQPPTKADIMRISSILNLAQGELLQLAKKEFGTLPKSNPKEKDSIGGDLINNDNE